jgi:hypothetical protein
MNKEVPHEEMTPPGAFSNLAAVLGEWEPPSASDLYLENQVLKEMLDDAEERLDEAEHYIAELEAGMVKASEWQ